jgi:septal ring factor EnvC (AmiA/AmiB activator)
MKWKRKSVCLFIQFLKVTIVVEFLLNSCNEADIPMLSWTGTKKPIKKARNMQELDEMDEQLCQFEERIQQMRKNQKVLEEQHADLCEQRDVLVELSVFLEDVNFLLFLCDFL